MESEFWHERWKYNEIAFHQPEVNPLLSLYFDQLPLPSTGRILVPLCGKSLDLSWLSHRARSVVGVELSTLAAAAFFDELDIAPTITPKGKLTAYQANNIEILVGDLFDLTQETLGPVAAVYDRAALVALPEAMRARYTQHVINLTDRAPQLLINYVYDQSLMPGPPFSIVDDEIHRHYHEDYQITLLHSQNVVGNLKGHSATEKIWLLK